MTSVVAVVPAGDATVAVPEIGTLNSKEQREYDGLLADAHSWADKGRNAMIRFGGALRDIKASGVVSKRHGDGGWAALIEREFGLTGRHANSIIQFTKVQDALLEAPEVGRTLPGLSISAAGAIAPVLLPEGGEATPESTAAAVTVLTEAAESSPSGTATAAGIAAAIASPAPAPKPAPKKAKSKVPFSVMVAAAIEAHDPAVCVVTVKFNRGKAIYLPCPGWPNPIPGHNWTYMIDSDEKNTLYFDDTDPAKGWYRTAHDWKGGGAKR